jgi:ATP-binding cassette subfamily F protein 3
MIERHPRLRFGYFDQHSVEQLSTEETSKLSPLTHFIESLKGENGVDLDEGTARGVLGSFGLGGKRAIEPIAALSGGQKVCSAPFR